MEFIKIWLSPFLLLPVAGLIITSKLPALYHDGINSDIIHQIVKSLLRLDLFKFYLEELNE